MSPVVFFQKHKEVLENFFTRSFFTSENVRHPAYKQWALCNKLINQQGVIKYPEQNEELVDIANIVLTTSVLVSASGHQIQDINFGDLSFLADSKTIKHWSALARNEDQFEDVMLELRFAAWHLMSQNNVTPAQNEGAPDWCVEFLPSKELAFFECKNLHSEKMLHKKIKKANKQLRNRTPGTFGFTVLKVSIVKEDFAVASEDIPPKVQEFKNKIASEIRFNFKHTDEVVLLWDDFLVIGRPPQRVAIALRSRFLRISQGEIGRIPEKMIPYNGMTVEFHIDFTPRK